MDDQIFVEGKALDEKGFDELVMGKIRQAQEEQAARWHDLKQRVGNFRVRRTLIEQAFDEFMKIMGQMIIVRAELVYDRDAFEYTAISPLFEIVPESETPPEYTFETRIDNGELKVSVHRMG